MKTQKRLYQIKCAYFHSLFFINDTNLFLSARGELTTHKVDLPRKIIYWNNVSAVKEIVQVTFSFDDREIPFTNEQNNVDVDIRKQQL